MSFTREEYEQVVRALFPAEDADEMLNTYDQGWVGFQEGGPVGLGLAAISASYAATLVHDRPDLVSTVEQLRRNPVKALARLRAQLWGEDTKP